MVLAVLTDQIPVELKEGTEVTLANTILTYGERYFPCHNNTFY